MNEVLELLIPYTKRHKKEFLGLNISIISAAIAQALIPLKISSIIDNGLIHRNKQVLYSGFFILLLLTMMDFMSQMGQRLFSNRYSNGVIYDIRQDLYVALQYQEIEYYSSETIGQIMARSIEEVLALRELLTWGYRITGLLTFLFITSFIAMVGISLPLSLVFLLLPVLLYRYVTGSSQRNVKLFYDARVKYGDLNDSLAEDLTGIKTVKSFGRELEQIAIFNVKNQEFFDASMKTVKIRSSLQAGAIFLISIGLVILVFLGGILLDQNQLTPGEYVAFMLLVLQITVPGRFTGWIGIILQNAQSAAIRLNEIFNAPVAIQEKIDPQSLQNFSGNIKFENVSFKYPAAKNFANAHTLHEINLEIPAGQKVALLGPTGSGKSSLINLIPRFFDPIEGRVLVDGIDLKHISLKSLRGQIGIVHQEAFLFTLSLHDNIAFGRSNATREQVIEAAKAAQIHEYIMTLEDGYDTIVGERGVTLSGGQRQRVTIARTLLHNPKILIFDDSVSAVDPETEAKIQESLESASSSRTTIIISQRPSSLKYVDRIIVLDKGRIVQDGTHSELMKEDNIYKDFINAVETQIKFFDWSQKIEEPET